MSCRENKLLIFQIFCKLLMKGKYWDFQLGSKMLTAANITVMLLWVWRKNVKRSLQSVSRQIEWTGSKKKKKSCILGAKKNNFCCCSVTESSLTLQPHGLEHTRLCCPSVSPGVCSDSCPLSQWCYLTISSSAAPFLFAFSLSHYQVLFQWVGSLHQVAKEK